MNTYAIVRSPAYSYLNCISNHPQRSTIDIYRVYEQYANYIAALKELGCRILERPALKTLPDSCFVEDRCIVAENTAAITSSKVSGRKGEEDDLIYLIMQYRQVDFIKKPGYVDGGDIIIVGDTLYGGISKRTNLKGLEQLAEILNKNLVSIQVPSITLHLKTISSFIGEKTILVREDLSYLWEDKNFHIIKVPMKEEHAANCIVKGNKIIAPAGCPKTISVLKTLGLEVIELEMSEFQKGDGSLTCLSVIFESGK